MKATLKNYKKIFVIAGAVLILLIALGVLSYMFMRFLRRRTVRIHKT